MSSREFAEWYEVWKWQPWAPVPKPPQEETEIDPMSFVNQINGQ